MHAFAVAALALTFVLGTAGGAVASAPSRDSEPAHGGDLSVQSAGHGQPGSDQNGRPSPDKPAPSVSIDLVLPQLPEVFLAPAPPVAVPPTPPVVVAPTPSAPGAVTPAVPVTVTPSVLAAPAPAPAAGASARRSDDPASASAVAPTFAATVRHGQLDLSRPGAVARLVRRMAQPLTALLLLLALAAVFLLVSGRLDRRHPRLVGAPLDRRDDRLEFG